MFVLCINFLPLVSGEKQARMSRQQCLTHGWFRFLPGHQPAASKYPDPRDPGVPGERPGGERSEETLQPGAEESAAGRVPPGESCRIHSQALD